MRGVALKGFFGRIRLYITRFGAYFWAASSVTQAAGRLAELKGRVSPDGVSPYYLEGRVLWAVSSVTLSAGRVEMGKRQQKIRLYYPPECSFWR